MLGLAVAIALTGTATTVHAQLDSFVQAVRALADAAVQKPVQTAAIRTAVERMGTSLAEWDRTLAALEGRVSRDIAGASGRQAYQLRVELGVAYQARGRTADALKQFEAAVALQPPASDVQVLRALALEAAGRIDEAGTAFRAAWAADSGNPVKAYYVAQRTKPSGATGSDAERARAVLADTYKRLDIGVRHSVAGFPTPAAIPDTLSRTPIVGDSMTARGFALIAEGRYTEAVAALTRQTTANDARHDDSPLVQLAQGQRDEAANRVAEARRAYGAALGGALAGRSVLYVGIARLAQVEGDLPGAIDAFTQAVRLSPNDPTIHREFAAAYVAHGVADAAFCELMAALLVDPRDAQAHADVGQLYLDTSRDAEAVTAFDRALTLAPKRYEFRYALATAHTRLGHSAEAARQLELFERARREALDERRRAIANEVEQAEGARSGAPGR